MPDYQAIDELRRQAAEARTRAGSFSSAAETFPGRIMERVRSARAERGTSQLATDVGETMGHLVRSGAEVRERLADVNPLQTDVLTARERAGNLAQLGTEAQYGQEMGGTITEAIGAGTEQIKALAERELAMAEQKKQEAIDMLDRLKFDEEIRQFNEQMLMERQKIGGRGRGGISEEAIQEIKNAFMGSNQTSSSQMYGPPYTAGKAGMVEYYNGGKFVSDDRGNWIYQGQIPSIETMGRPPLSSFEY